jgi:hypothetical protein
LERFRYELSVELRTELGVFKSQLVTLALDLLKVRLPAGDVFRRLNLLQAFPQSRQCGPFFSRYQRSSVRPLANKMDSDRHRVGIFVWVAFAGFTLGHFFAVTGKQRSSSA